MQQELERDETSGIFSKENQIGEIEGMKKEIDKLMEEKTRGAMVRSRADWFLYEEKPTSYFCKLEKYNYTKKNRFRLKREDGSITTNSEDILRKNSMISTKIYTLEQIFKWTRIILVI